MMREVRDTIIILLLCLLVLLVHDQNLAHAYVPDHKRDIVQYRKHIIRKIFKRHGSDAIRVAMCESGINPTARNGQYLGTFQMGRYERATYGHGHSTWEQSRAAYRYFKAVGYSWRPWQCKP
jgi:hypothetical protein